MYDEESIKEQIQLILAEWKIEKVKNPEANFEEFLKEKVGSENVQKVDDDTYQLKINGKTFNVTEQGEISLSEGISLNRTTLKILYGEIETLVATKTDNIKEEIVWSSSNDKVVTVTNGKVVAVGNGGTAEITATAGKFSAKCTVTVVAKLTSISIKIEGGEINKGDTVALTVTKEPNNVETEEIIFSSSDSNRAQVDENGNVTGITSGYVTIKAEGKQSSVFGECNVYVVAEPAIGDYVDYNVTYTDMYVTSTTFESTQGWRILDIGTKNIDETYSGVKLISTGIPAMLYYGRDDTTYTDWWGTEEEAGSSSREMRAAYGLANKFNKITFIYGTSKGNYNQGYYRNIKGQTSGKLPEDAFIAYDNNVNALATEVHNLSLEELNKARGKSLKDTSRVDVDEPAKGLFYSRNLNDFGYSYFQGNMYWLATSGGSLWRSLLDVLDYKINDDYNRVLGVRPVVSLKANITLIKNGEGWKIQ